MTNPQWPQLAVSIASYLTGRDSGWNFKATSYILYKQLRAGETSQVCAEGGGEDHQRSKVRMHLRTKDETVGGEVNSEDEASLDTH